jgi:hypothetical protein
LGNITNNADNRIITGTATTGQLNGEAQATFDGTTFRIGVSTAGALGVGTGAGTPTTDGLIRATNDVIAYYSSDERLKTNVVALTNPLKKINKIGGYEFDWIVKEGIHENEGHDIGVIAQEVESVLPEVVTTRNNGYKAVKYEKLVALLIECIKEQNKEIELLKRHIGYPSSETE